MYTRCRQDLISLHFTNSLCPPHRPAPSSGSPQRNAGSPPELHGHTQSLAPLCGTVREEKDFLHLWLIDTATNTSNNNVNKTTNLYSKSTYSRVKVQTGLEDMQWYLYSAAVWAEQVSPTVVWRPVWGGRSAGPAAPLPHPAAFWLYGCHSALAGSSGCWWYSIARLWGQGREKGKG